MGTLGFLKPAAVAWLKGELVTLSLALTMLFMGMTLTVRILQFSFSDLLYSKYTRYTR